VSASALESASESESASALESESESASALAMTKASGLARDPVLRRHQNL
jgi:hypothetical protein